MGWPKIACGVFFLFVGIVIGGVCGTTPVRHEFVYAAAGLCFFLTLFTHYKARRSEEEDSSWHVVHIYARYALSIACGICCVSLLIQKYGLPNRSVSELLTSGLFGGGGSLLLYRTLLVDQLVVAKRTDREE